MRPDMKPHTSTIPPSPALFYFTAFTALLADTAAALSLGEPFGLLQGIGLHLCAIALVGGWAYFARRHYERDRFSAFLLPLTMVAGPFGAGICLLAALVYAHCSPDAVSPSEWIESLFEREKDRESDRLHERIVLGLDDFEAAANVEPFRDILAGGTILQKQMAVAKIARHFRPQFAPLLLQAANDLNAAVRVQAATALAKIERDFMARYIKLENALKDLPDYDPAKLKLAELYDDYAHAGLLDDNNRQSLRLKAIAIYEACLAQKDNSEWRIRLARLYLRHDRPEEARRWLQPVIESENAPRGAMYWYMETLFRLKKFGDLRKLAGRDVPLPLKKTGHQPYFGEVESVVDVWQSSAAAEARHDS
jgi:hypothetical protein